MFIRFLYLFHGFGVMECWRIGLSFCKHFPSLLQYSITPIHCPLKFSSPLLNRWIFSYTQFYLSIKSQAKITTITKDGNILMTLIFFISRIFRPSPKRSIPPTADSSLITAMSK